LRNLDEVDKESGLKRRDLARSIEFGSSQAAPVPAWRKAISVTSIKYRQAGNP